MNKKLTSRLAFAVALATFIVYLPALRNDFVGVWDDNIYIGENHHIRSLGAGFFRWAFFEFHASNWHPLTWLSHALDYALWGINPLGHHLTSIVLHAINTALVVLLVMKLIEAAQKRATPEGPASFLEERTALIASGVTGLLFGIHPVHVESVAWAAERKDLLCALFFLLSIIVYLDSARGQGSGHQGNAALKPKQGFFNKQYLLVLGLFVLALLSKPMAVSLPVVLLILDWYPLGRIRSGKELWRAGVEKFPFLALSFASSIITIFAQQSGESIGYLQITPASTRLLVAAHALAAYLANMAIPLNLVPYYPYPGDVSLFSFRYFLAVALVAGITAACVMLAKKQKLWLSAWAYFVATLIPVLGIVQVGNQSMADRYTYLPGLGPFLIAGLFAAWITNKTGGFSSRGTAATVVCAAGAFVAIVLLSFLTIKQTGIWKNGLVLWSHVLEKGYESATAYNNRGLSLDDRGMREEARADFVRAAALDPRNYFAYNNLGVLFGEDGSYARSIEYFLKAISLNPRHADSYCNLGLSYFNMRQFGNALESYNQAIGLKRDFDAAYLNRGNLYFVIGEKERALADYRKACDLGNRKACEAFHLAAQGLLFR